MLRTVGMGGLYVKDSGEGGLYVKDSGDGRAIFEGFVLFSLLIGKFPSFSEQASSSSGIKGTSAG